MSHLDKLTLIMLTYERQDLAIRNMGYWSGVGPIVRVMDGSACPIESSKLQRFDDNIIYKHGPSSYIERLKIVLGEIDTEFVALIGDDEFFIKTSVERCILELINDQNIVACCGRSLGFIPSQDVVHGVQIYSGLRGYEVMQADPRSRLLHHMNNYIPSLIYSVARRQVWVESFEAFTRKEFPVFAIGEIQIEMCMSVSGRSKVLPILMWLRSLGEAEPIRGTNPSLDESKTFSNWWEAAGASGERLEFIEIMSDQFKKFGLSEDGQKSGIVVDACNAYIRFIRNGWLPNSLWQKFKHNIKKIMPSIIHESIWTKIFINNSINLEMTLLDHAKFLVNEGVKVDFKALGEIEESILNFHKFKNGAAEQVEVKSNV